MSVTTLALAIGVSSSARAECTTKSAPCPDSSTTHAEGVSIRRAPGSYTGVSAALGLGHGFGAFGLQVAVPVVVGEGLSVGPFVGAGAFPSMGEAEGHWLFAGGVLGYWGARHRLLAEVSFAPIGVRVLQLHGTVVATQPAYGPGAIIGYEFVAMTGFLIRAGIGAGVTLDDEPEVLPLLSLGIGWKW